MRIVHTAPATGWRIAAIRPTKNNAGNVEEYPVLFFAISDESMPEDCLDDVEAGACAPDAPLTYAAIDGGTGGVRYIVPGINGYLLLAPGYKPLALQEGATKKVTYYLEAIKMSTREECAA